VEPGQFDRPSFQHAIVGDSRGANKCSVFCVHPSSSPPISGLGPLQVTRRKSCRILPGTPASLHALSHDRRNWKAIYRLERFYACFAICFSDGSVRLE